MDAEDYYESRRLKDEAAVDRFHALKAKWLIYMATNIRRIFARGFAGDTMARLPHVRLMPSGNDEIVWSTRLNDALLDVCTGDQLIALLIEATDPAQGNPSAKLGEFREKCIQAYINEYAEELAEVAAQEEFDSIKRGDL